MKKWCIITIGIVFGAFVHIKAYTYRNCENANNEISRNRKEIERLKKELRETRDSFAAGMTNSFGQVYEELGRQRFMIKAIGNTLKFIEVK